MNTEDVWNEMITVNIDDTNTTIIFRDEPIFADGNKIIKKPKWVTTLEAKSYVDCAIDMAILTNNRTFEISIYDLIEMNYAGTRI